MPVRRMMAAVLALLALVAVAGTAGGAAPAEAASSERAPSPPRPGGARGPGPLYPLDQYGPRPDDNVVLRWNEQALSAIRATRPAPTVVARSLAIVQTCVYDAWAAYDARAVGTRLGATLRRPAGEHTDAHKSKAISYAAHEALLDLFPSRRADIDGLMTTMGYDPADASTDTTTPEGIGNVACGAVLAFRHGDGSNQLGDHNGGAPYSDYTGYRPVNGPDTVADRLRWQPLRVPDGSGGSAVQAFATPHWGQVTPFALSRPDQFPVPGPGLGKQGDYAAAVDQLVRETGALDDRKKVVAEYWADGPASELPPGHWNIFAQALSRARGNTLDQDVALFFALDNAMLDSSIAAWHLKRTHDFVRPITAIRESKRGVMINGWRGPYLGNGRIRGETWRPYQPATAPTPPFPDYVSGHSTFSAAAAEVLRTFSGSDQIGVPISVTVRAGTGRVEPGSVPRNDIRLSWPSFSAAADEAGVSRRYGGIHFEDADGHGRALGRSIGAQSWNRAQAYLRGGA